MLTRARKNRIIAQRRRNMKAPINRILNEDVFALVFEACLPDESEEENKTGFAVAVNLASVCQYWYTMVTHCTAMWSRITLASSHTGDHNILPTMLARSKAHRLHLNLPSIDRLDDSVMQQLYVYFERCVSVRLSTSYANAAAVAYPFNTVPSRHSSLQQLNLRGIAIASEDVLLSMLAHFEHLEDLVLDTVMVMHLRSGTTPITLKHVQRLKLCGRRASGTGELGPSVLHRLELPNLLEAKILWPITEIEWQESISSGNQKMRWSAPRLASLSMKGIIFATVEDLVSVLRGFSLLQSLEFEAKRPMVCLGHPALRLPMDKLTRITFIERSAPPRAHSAIAHFPAHIDAPNLSSLTLLTDASVIWHPRLQPWASTRSLSINGAWSDSSVLCCLSAMPRLEELFIGGASHVSLTDNLWLWISRKGYSPILRTLTLRFLPTITVDGLTKFLKARSERSKRLHCLDVKYCCQLGSADAARELWEVVDRLRWEDRYFFVAPRADTVWD